MNEERERPGPGPDLDRLKLPERDWNEAVRKALKKPSLTTRPKPPRQRKK